MSGAQSLKLRVRSMLVDTALRHLAAPMYRALTRVEIAGTRLIDGLRFESEPITDTLARRVTVIIKTFERPRELERLLGSLRRLFPSVPVVVADDGESPQLRDGVHTIALPFDSGVSAGRQAALERVGTEYTWVLDDDFVLYRGTRLGRVLRILDQNPQIDILGGPVIDLPLARKQGGADSPLYPTSSAPVLPLGTRVGEVTVRDKVPNFFVARTERLRLVGWSGALKRLDHADFFTRARGVLVTAYDDAFRCLHAQTPFDRHYMQHRTDLAADEAVLRERYFS